MTVHFTIYLMLLQQKLYGYGLVDDAGKNSWVMSIMARMLH